MKTNKRIFLLAVCIAVSIVANAQSEQWKTYLDMEAALQCGDTATFKRLAFRVVRWKGWNPLVFYYTDQYKFLRDCDWWPELDSIQRAIHGRKDYSYAETLYQMEQEDQAARRAFNRRSATVSGANFPLSATVSGANFPLSATVSGANDPDHTHTKDLEDSLSNRMHEVDSVNLARLIWLMDTLGFPSWDRVCAYGARSAWLIAQHAHPWFQYGYVKQMRKAVADTNADPSNLAYLEDRLRTGRGLPQLYGTQFTSTGDNNRTVWQCPIADIKNVNLRRGQMLMPPLEDYIEGYLKAETERGLLDSDTPLIEMGENYVRYYYRGDQYSLQPIDEQEGVTDAVAYMATGDYCAAIPIFCSRLSNLYPFVRDLKHYLECLLHSECVGNQYCYISHYEVLERIVLCGYEPDAWLDSLPDTLTVPLLTDYSNLRDEYLRYLNHEDDAELTAALANRADFEALLRSGKNYHRYELDAWNHAYPLLQKMTDELTKGDYEEFFALLWREVERGNLHAEDYASLYDRTYYRLYGKDWYGTESRRPSVEPTLAASDKHIRTAKPKMLNRRSATVSGANERRRAACLTVASAQDTLTPAQMREDFNYMMEQYERIHPNPTWSLGGERYSELKQQTLAQLDHPMTQLYFWRIIARWNQHFDGHTQVGFPPSAPRMPEGMMVFPPKSIVQYRDNKLFFSAYEAMPDSLQGCEILAINGHPSAEIIDSIMPYISHESEAHINNVILRSLYWFYQAFYGYSSQMEFLYRTIDGENTVLSDRRVLYTWLVQVGDMGEIGGVGPRDIPWHFSIFPEQGIALFEFNSCGPNDKFPQFDSVVTACIDSVNHYGIRRLFVDISHNSGGNDSFCKRFLCHIDGLPDTVAAMDMTDTEMGTIANPEEKRVTMTFTPKRPLYGGKLYLIQSQFTYSAAVLLANLAKQYRLGTVIGEETGGLTTTFTRHNPILLPHSGLTFYCSDKQFRHIGTTGSRGVLPDIPLEIGYKYLLRSFTAEELQQMIK